jgi:hypothetical protein
VSIAATSAQSPHPCRAYARPRLVVDLARPVVRERRRRTDRSRALDYLGPVWSGELRGLDGDGSGVTDRSPDAAPAAAASRSARTSG